MVRKHGWQLPAHTFQVVAITVFCLLVVAFYAFFAPFLGGHIWEYILVGTYSPVAFLVFILYVRCTAINPADPGIMSKFNGKEMHKPSQNSGLNSKDLHGKVDEDVTGLHSSPSTASRSSMAATNSNKKGAAGENGRTQTQMKSSACKSFWTCGGILCALFAHEDCRNQEGAVELQGTGNEDALYCTLCNAEVQKFSKHCRSCDKCVDGFDHHCRWLNNCVGYRNYVTFISLMAISLVWLAIEAGVGIAVFTRCFVNSKKMEAEIVDRLGDGFSRAPFASVVAVCTVVSILACVPLGELFFFHMILIKKGITTYEYVVAMRAMSEAPAGASVDEELQEVLYSPSGSATTALSGGSSLGLQYKGTWCTPPRVFVDYQDEVIPHLEPGMVPSTVDPDAAALEGGQKMQKRPVRISAWKLAKLDSREAVRAAAKARASSSVLKPIDNRHLAYPDMSSSGNMSVRSSVSTDVGGNRDTKNDQRIPSFRNSSAPSQCSQDEYDTGTQSVSSFSSPSHVHESVTLSPLPQAHGFGASAPGIIPARPLTSRVAYPNVTNPTSNPSLGFDERIRASSTDPLLLSSSTASLLKDVKRTSVVWDQEAGRYVSVPLSSSETRNRSSLQMPMQNIKSEKSAYGRKPILPHHESSSSAATSSILKSTHMGESSSVQQVQKLTYTGDSIFFGGPLLGVPVRDNYRNEKHSNFVEGQERSLNLQRESRFKRDSASHQLPVFIPGGSEQNPHLGSNFK